MKIAHVLVACPVLLFSVAASAQEVQVQVGLPPPPPPPRVVIEAQPPPYYGPGYGRRPMYYEPGSLDRPRLRLAFGVTGGPYIGDNFGGAGGFWGQGGVQI